MIPCLYGAMETEFATNGIGKLADACSCTVEEKRNSSYELKLTYPADGIHAPDIVEDNIILAKPNLTSKEQPFRIYKVTSPLSGKLEVQARHISYRLNFITVKPVSIDGCINALDMLKKWAAEDCPFTFETDVLSTARFSLKEPASLRNCLGGMDGSVLDTFGGEFEWDGFTVRLHKARGKDNGVRIVYGKNLTDFKMERSVENVITGVHPYWKDSESGAVSQLPEVVVTAEDSTSPYPKITVLDCSSEFQECPTADEMREYAQSYLDSTSLKDPDIDITIDFVQLWDTPGYEDVAEAEAVSLCDTVHVYVSKLGIEVSAKVTETVYDVLLGRYKSVTLSNSTVTSRNTSLTASLNGIRNTAAEAYTIASKAESNVTAQTTELGNCCKLDSSLLTGLFGLHYAAKTEDGKATRYAFDAEDISASSNAWKEDDSGFFYSTDGGKTWGYAWDGDTAVKTALLLQGTLDELDERYEKAGALTDELLEELDKRYGTAKKLSADLLKELDERYEKADALTDSLWERLDEKYRAASELTEALQESLDERYREASALSAGLQETLDKRYQAAVALAEPEEPALNALWIDTDASRLKLWDGEKWVVIGYEPEETEPTDPDDTDTPTDDSDGTDLDDNGRDNTETDNSDNTDIDNTGADNAETDNMDTDQTEEGGNA